MTKEPLLKGWLPPLLIIAAGVLAYWNSFDGVFVYDDLDSIRDNPHIRALWPLSKAMSVPLWSSATTVDGRPLLSLSLALNYALFGPEPWGYHLINLLIHISAGLLLFGVVKRTLELLRLDRRSLGEVGFRERHAGSGRWIALTTALIWLVHPLQTESVTYIVQRAESLMGMLFLLALYCAIRGFRVPSSEFRVQAVEESSASEAKATKNARHTSSCSHARQSVDDRATGDFRFSARGGSAFEGQVSSVRFHAQRRWCVAAVASCAIGMGVKQTMFSAPLLILLYDWVFVSESLRSALVKRKWFYGALCATWLIIFGIIGATWKESTIDFVKISPIGYLLTQPLVLLYYLRLAVWPSPLVLDYGWPLEDQWYRIVFPGLAILGMLAVMFRGLWHRKWYGVVMAWFFLILAPTSSIAPTRQAIFEHRMYLSLAAVMLLLVMAAEHALRKLPCAPKRRAVLGGSVVTIILLALVCLTHDRNRDYHSEIGIWREDVAQRPLNPLAHLNLGNAVQAAGSPLGAVPHYREALRLAPGYAEAHYNWGVALDAAGRPQEAIQHYQQAMQRKADYAEAHNNMTHALLATGRFQEAVDHAREALRINPELADAEFNLGNALQALGSSEAAIGHYQRALRIRPDYAEAYTGWGNVLLASGRLEESIGQYREALRIKPEDAKAQYHWGMALEAARRPQEAMSHYREAIRINLGMAEAHLNLGNVMLTLGRPEHAIDHYQRALRVRPGYVQAQQNIRIALRQLEEVGGAQIPKRPNTQIPKVE